jgi:hypothetical protein
MVKKRDEVQITRNKMQVNFKLQKIPLNLSHVEIGSWDRLFTKGRDTGYSTEILTAGRARLRMGEEKDELAVLGFY